MLKEGQKAPDFSLSNQHGQTVSLKSLKGKKVVLYFYPKDNTPGCTTEAKDFTESLNTFTDNNTVILGVSKDSEKSHQSFIEKQDLKIDLLSDPEGTACEAYGVWREKQNYGKTYMGIVRSTFLIDEKGVIQKIWDNVRVKGHAHAVLESCSI